MNNKPLPAGGRVLVVGAGIVGTCCAVFLQRSGFQTLLVDRDPPGEACSFGNGGVLGLSSCIPLSMPGILKKVPGMLLDPEKPLVVRPAYGLKVLPWFVRFALNSRRHRVEAIADARNGLLKHLFDAYEPILADSGADALIRRDGLLTVYESEESFRHDRYADDIRRRRGIRVEELGPDEIRQLEPALSPTVTHGVFMPDVGYTVNPLRLTQTLVAYFQERGGTLLRESVTDFEIGEGGPSRVITDAGGHDVDGVVLAAGAWSRPLAERLGASVPLEAMRGYHVVLPQPGVEVRHTIIAADRRCGITPMETGLRLGGTAEFAGVDAAPDMARADMVVRQASGLFRDGLNREGMTRWMGPRPAMPDSRPVLGPSPRHRNAFFAFGHDQIGLALGAISGRIIADLASGKDPGIDLTPYRADRF